MGNQARHDKYVDRPWQAMTKRNQQKLKIFLQKNLYPNIGLAKKSVYLNACFCNQTLLDGRIIESIRHRIMQACDLFG